MESKGDDDLAKRIITSVIGIPLLIAIIAFGGIPLKIALIGVSLIGVYEFYRAVNLNKEIKAINDLGYLFVIVFSFILSNFSFQSYLLFTTAFIMSLFISMLLNHQKYNINDVAITYIGFYYVCFLLSHIVMLRQISGGFIFVWLIFITAWGSDTGAYFTGSAIGKHKLAPKLSPHKTIEGAIGGVVLSTVLCIIYGFCIMKLTNTDISILNFALIGIAGSIVGQLGDLGASAIKRYTGIKDYGNLFPGHGGVLDRFDSILFTAPLVYYLVVLLKMR